MEISSIRLDFGGVVSSRLLYRVPSFGFFSILLEGRSGFGILERTARTTYLPTYLIKRHLAQNNTSLQEVCTSLYSSPPFCL